MSRIVHIALKVDDLSSTLARFVSLAPLDCLRPELPSGLSLRVEDRPRGAQSKPRISGHLYALASRSGEEFGL